MRKLVRASFAFSLVAGACLLPVLAQARPIEVKAVKWVNSNRGTGGCPNCANDTTYGGLSTTKVDTSNVISLQETKPYILRTSSTADSSQVYMGRITVVSDSVAAGNLTAITVQFQAVYASTNATTTAKNAIPPAVIPLQSQSVTIPTGRLAFSIPVIFPGNQQSVTQNGDATGNLLSMGLGHPAFRVIMTATAGTMSRVKLIYSFDNGSPLGY